MQLVCKICETKTEIVNNSTLICILENISCDKLYSNSGIAYWDYIPYVYALSSRVW